MESRNVPGEKEHYLNSRVQTQRRNGRTGVNPCLKMRGNFHNTAIHWIKTWATGRQMDLFPCTVSVPHPKKIMPTISTPLKYTSSLPFPLFYFLSFNFSPLLSNSNNKGTHEFGWQKIAVPSLWVTTRDTFLQNQGKGTFGPPNRWPSVEGVLG